MSWQILPTDTGDLAEGLQARVADPLWMLFRQWTVRELTGESAGTPTRLTVTREEVSIGPSPLEAEVEAEDVLADPIQRFRIAAEAGRHLAGIVGDVRAAELRRDHALDVPSDLVGADRIRARVWARTGLDGLDALGGSHLQASERAALESWLQQTYGVQRRGGWDPGQLAYTANIAVGDGFLSLDGYAGGRLDWTDFALARSPSPEESVTTEVLPARVTFPGMPERRFWSSEDSQVNFGELDVEADRVPHLIVSEFAVMYGDDWFVVPVTVNRGRLVRISAISVVDSFGETWSLGSSRKADIGRPRAWGLWELTSDTGSSPWLFVPPPMSSPTQGAPIEQVRLWRDEASNRGIAAEQRVARAMGAARIVPAAEPATPEGPGWVYQLRPAVPVGWFPLLVTPRPDSAQIDFRPGRFSGQGTPRGSVLTELEGSVISEDLLHLPQLVTRRWQLARTGDGGRVLWLGRERRASKSLPSERPLVHDSVSWVTE